MDSRKILVIEDDPEMRLALQIRLKANGYEIFLAVDGVSAIAEARKHMPDLIFLDLGLPAGSVALTPAVSERRASLDRCSSVVASRSR